MRNWHHGAYKPHVAQVPIQCNRWTTLIIPVYKKKIMESKNYKHDQTPLFESNNILTHLPISPLSFGLWSFRGTMA